MRLTRREMLKLSLLGGAAVALPLERGARTQLAVADRLPESRLPAPFQAAFTVPPVAKPVYRSATTDYYQMSMKQGFHQIIPGLPKTEVWGYEGLTPGPTIAVERGRKVVVRHKNLIDSPLHEHTSVHLHGNASLPQYDGYANDITRPGEYKDYHYPNYQDARTLWYHDHGVHSTGFNAYMGCAAMYVSHDGLERSLCNKGDGSHKEVGTALPSGPYDVPLVLRDAIFGTDGSLIFDDQGQSSLFGDVILANGAPWPKMKVERRKYRFRVLNGSISRGFNLALSTGDPITVVGHDGGLTTAPIVVDSMRVGMAERYEIVIDFARYAPGTNVDLMNRGLTNIADFANTNKVMRFEVQDTPADNTPLPTRLNPDNEVMKLQESQAVRTRNFDFGRAIIGGKEMWTINDKIWDPARVDANPGVGDVEIWEFKNNSGGWFHPIHVHLIDYKILDRNGRAPFAYENGPKDTVYLGEGETVRVIAKFGPHKGKYMIHCHNLVHEDHDMMTQFEVGSGGPDPVLSDPAKPIAEAGPLYTPDGNSGGGSGGGGSDDPPPVRNTAPIIHGMRPAPNRLVRGASATVSAIVRDAQTRLTGANVRLWVDGRRIWRFRYDPRTGRLSYAAKNLKRGRHTVKITATDARGRSTTKVWAFRVVAR